MSELSEDPTKIHLASSPGFEGRRPSPWVYLTPFFSSALLFLSVFFAVLAPLPLLLLAFRKGKSWIWFAALTNSILVWVLAGGVSGVIFIALIVVMALAASEVLSRKISIEKAALLILLSMTAAGAIAVTTYSKVERVHPIAEIHNAISEFVEYFGKEPTSGQAPGTPASASKAGELFGGGAPMEPAELEEWKQSLIVEFPSAVAVIGLILVWLNLTLLIRINPGQLRERLGLPPNFLQMWKSPEYLIWPTIASGVTLIIDLGPVSQVGQNIFKFLMAIYAIQGLSILSYFFNLWHLRKFLRLLGYLVVGMVLTPLLLSLGFFDLWFDFRSKFRQS